MPFQSSAHARIAALSRVAKEPSGEAMTRQARTKFRDSFAIEHVNCPYGCKDTVIDQTLPAKERKRMADAAFAAHMGRISHRRTLLNQRANNARREARRLGYQEKKLRGDDAV